MTSWPEIQNAMLTRRDADAAMIRRMVTIRDHNNNDIVIPLPDVVEEPNLKPLMPGLIYEGIEGTAMRASGPSPNIHVPALDETKDTGINSKQFAAIRRRALYGRWHQSRMPLLLNRGYRQLTGYGSMALVAVCDWALPKPQGPGARIEYRNALSAYPEPRAAEDIRAPANAGFVFSRSGDWIASTYGGQAAEMVGRYHAKHRGSTGLWDLVEWIDEFDVVIGIIGPQDLYTSGTPYDPDIHGDTGMELRRWANLAGRCTAVVPRRITLDRIAGQLDNAVPIVEWMHRLMALEVAAAEKHVFPDMVALGQDSREPRIISSGGDWADGRSGDINLLSGVSDVKLMQGSPGPLTDMVLNRLERSGRIMSGASPQFAGENSGMRTGRGLSELGGFSIDPRIAELQRIMAYCLTDMNEIVIDLEKGYWRDQKYVVFSGWPSDIGMAEYSPGKHFESNTNIVTYNFPGMDVSQITVAVAQLTASKLMSRATARDKHPFIDDKEMEERSIIEESIDDAILVSWQQRAAAGELPIEVLAAVKQKVNAGVPHAQAILDVSKAEQERQAAAQETAAAQMPVGPEGQPGLGGTIPEELAAQVSPGPSGEQRNLSNLVRSVAAPAYIGGQQG